MTFSLCISLPENEEIRSGWDHVRSNFKADMLYVIGGKYLKSAADLPDQPLVMLQPKSGIFLRGATSLVDFRHPESPIYMFGPDIGPMLPEYLGGRKPDHSVYIPSDRNREMFSFVAFAVVAWDRKMKLWQ